MPRYRKPERAIFNMPIGVSRRTRPAGANGAKTGKRKANARRARMKLDRIVISGTRAVEQLYMLSRSITPGGRLPFSLRPRSLARCACCACGTNLPSYGTALLLCHVPHAPCRSVCACERKALCGKDYARNQNNSRRIVILITRAVEQPFVINPKCFEINL